MLTRLWSNAMCSVRTLAEAVCATFVGRAFGLPEDLLTRHPGLAVARWRRAGLPPRIGGWALGRSSVLGIAVGRTVFLAPGAQLDAWLLLHEVAHVHQFQRIVGFPALYLWESLRRGYRANRFELEADAWAALSISNDARHLAKSAEPQSLSDRGGIEDLPSRGV